MMNHFDVSVIIGLAETRQPVRVLEIGVYDGMLSKCLLSTISSIQQYIGIDMPSDVAAFEKSEDASTTIEGRGNLALDDSRFILMLPVAGMAVLCPETLPRNVDLCIIDADHRYESVKRDTGLAAACVRPGGLIIWHDFDREHEGVFQFLSEYGEAHPIMSMGTLAWREVEKL